MKMFQFQIEAVENQDLDCPEKGPLPGDVEEGKTIGTTYNGANGQVIFKNVIFEGKDVGKSYLYKITESIPTEDVYKRQSTGNIKCTFINRK